MKKLFSTILVICSLLGGNAYAISLDECIKIATKGYIVNEEGIASGEQPYKLISWKVSFSNNCNKSIKGMPLFQFVDKNGYLIEEERKSYISIMSGGSKTVLGQIYIIGKNKIDRIYNTIATMEYLSIN